MQDAWIFYAWEDETFDKPEQAARSYELVPGQLLELHEVEARVVRTCRWQVAGDGTLTPLDGEQS